MYAMIRMIHHIPISLIRICGLVYAIVQSSVARRTLAPRLLNNASNDWLIPARDAEEFDGGASSGVRERGARRRCEDLRYG